MVENARSINIVASLILILGIVYIVGPLYLTLTTASHSYEFMLQNGLVWSFGGDFLVNIKRIFTDTSIPLQMVNSLIVAIGDAVATCVLSFLSAYAIVYFRVRWASVVFALILATVILPLDMRFVTTYQVASNVFSPLNAFLDVTGLNDLIEAVFGAPFHAEWSILNTHVGLVVPLLAHGMGTFLFRQFFLTLPKDLFKAARMDGAGPIRFLFDIMLPLSRTTFASLFILTFLSGWTQYLWPLVASSTAEMQTAVVGLARLVPDEGAVPDYPLIMAGAILVSIVPLAMIALLQRYLVQWPRPIGEMTMNAIDPAIHIAAANIRLDGVSKSYGAVTVIPKLDVEFREGEFTVVLGPSGCGKSTLMQMIAGLERVSGGKIFIGDREVQNLEPRERGCAMVFQNYALYPHMTVFDNIAYSLKIAGLTKPERRARVDVVAKMLGLTDYLDRKPGQLSGGQRQRVAIGRAIVREPAVLLFDEPLSNLDAQLRHGTRIELAELHRRIGATTVFVTHDQVEAMTLADRILILNKGEVEQYDTPKAIYHSPASVFVAKFIGSPPMNILPVSGDGSVLRLSDGQAVTECRLKGEFQLGIRPEDILVDRTGSSSALRAHVRYHEDLGSHSILAADVSGTMVRITMPFGSQAPDSNVLRLSCPQQKLHLFDTATGKAVAGAFNATTKDQ